MAFRVVRVFRSSKFTKAICTGFLGCAAVFCFTLQIRVKIFPETDSDFTLILQRCAWGRAEVPAGRDAVFQNDDRRRAGERRRAGSLTIFGKKRRGVPV